MPIYRPRMTAVLEVPTFGSTRMKDEQAAGTETTLVPVEVKAATWERNDHLTADTLVLEVEWMDAGIDPRFLKNATVDFWLGDIRSQDTLQTAKHHRFKGVCTKARRQLRSDHGADVVLEFSDYTSLFLANKPLPVDGVPSYDQTLQEAWERICDFTGWYDENAPNGVHSNVKNLRDRLRFKDFSLASAKLGDVVPGRFSKAGVKLSIKNDDNSWGVWQYCMGILGLISYIDGDECIVASTTEFWSRSTAPRFIWGKNIIDLNEQINTSISNKGIRLVSYSTLENKVLEAFYPPPGDKRIHVKRNVAKKKTYKADQIQSDQYITYEYHGIQVQQALDNVAKAAYLEFSRQEIEGSFTTSEMFLPHKETTFKLSGSDERGLDVLTLRAGDAIGVEIDEKSKQLLGNMSSAEQDIYLARRGYSPQIGELIKKNMSALSSLEPVFHITRTVTRIEPDKFEVEIHYHNLVDLKGHSVDPEEGG